MMSKLELVARRGCWSVPCSGSASETQVPREDLRLYFRMVSRAWCLLHMGYSPCEDLRLPTNLKRILRTIGTSHVVKAVQ